MESWRYHHKLQGTARVCRTINKGGGSWLYHGGDPVYKLEGIPGLWLEQCLVRAESVQVG
jgi:hypothetical protein